MGQAEDVQIVSIIKKLEEFGERLIKKLTLDITANLKETTPVDTSWARANWVPSIGSSPTKPAGERIRGSIDTQTQAAGLADVAANYKLYEVVYVTNNVPYIKDLNNGTSKQAPRFFVQTAIARGVEQQRGLKA